MESVLHTMQLTYVLHSDLLLGVGSKVIIVGIQFTLQLQPKSRQQTHKSQVKIKVHFYGTTFVHTAPSVALSSQTGPTLSLPTAGQAGTHGL